MVDRFRFTSFDEEPVQCGAATASGAGGTERSQTPLDRIISPRYERNEAGHIDYVYMIDLSDFEPEHVKVMLYGRKLQIQASRDRVTSRETEAGVSSVVEKKEYSKDIVLPSSFQAPSSSTSASDSPAKHIRTLYNDEGKLIIRVPVEKPASPPYQHHHQHHSSPASALSCLSMSPPGGLSPRYNIDTNNSSLTGDNMDDDDDDDAEEDGFIAASLSTIRSPRSATTLGAGMSASAMSPRSSRSHPQPESPLVKFNYDDKKLRSSLDENSMRSKVNEDDSSIKRSPPRYHQLSLPRSVASSSQQSHRNSSQSSMRTISPNPSFQLNDSNHHQHEVSTYHHHHHPHSQDRHHQFAANNNPRGHNARHTYYGKFHEKIQLDRRFNIEDINISLSKLGHLSISARIDRKNTANVGDANVSGGKSSCFTYSSEHNMPVDDLDLSSLSGRLFPDGTLVLEANWSNSYLRRHDTGKTLPVKLIDF